MKSKPVSSLEAVTRGELLAMCKLVQMVANSHQYIQISEREWKDKVMVAFDVGEEGADALINRSRQLANRVLVSAT